MTKTELISCAHDLYRFADKELRLNKCTAWYVKEDKWILRSYNTIVALFDPESHVLYVFGYWSSTTTQHIAKFIRLVRTVYGEIEVRYLFRRIDRRVSTKLSPFPPKCIDSFESTDWEEFIDYDTTTD